MSAAEVTRAETLAAVLAEHRERLFASERRSFTTGNYVIRSDDAQALWRDMTAALDAALTAQEGDRDEAVETALSERDEQERLAMQHSASANEWWGLYDQELRAKEVATGVIAAVEALLRKWERSIGPGSEEWADLDVSTMQVPFVVQQVRAVLADSAGTLAKHDAEVLRAAATSMPRFHTGPGSETPYRWLVEKPDSPWSREWRRRDIELMVESDKPRFSSKLMHVADYHVVLIGECYWCNEQVSPEGRCRCSNDVCDCGKTRDEHPTEGCKRLTKVSGR